MKCIDHPKYEGLQKPRVPCEDCWRVYISVKDQKSWQVFAGKELNRIKRGVV